MSKDTVIFLDVDGVLNHLYVWGENPNFDRHEFIHRDTERDNKPYRVAVMFPKWMPELVQYLVENHTVYWLTTWREYANEQLAPILGIPELPVITDGTGQRYVGWKPAAAAPVANELLAQGKRVVWIEDFYGKIPRNLMPAGVEFIDTGSSEGLFSHHLGQFDLPADLIDRARPGLPAGLECGECFSTSGRHKMSCSQRGGFIPACEECLAPEKWGHETWCSKFWDIWNEESKLRT